MPELPDYFYKPTRGASGPAEKIGYTSGTSSTAVGDAAAALQAALDAANAANADPPDEDATVLAAKKAGKDQTARENQATNDIVDSLMKSLQNYAGGRDKQLGNAQSVLDTTLSGILAQYTSAADDTEKYSDRNEADYDAKTNANVSNKVRESNEALAQALSQGAGETDVLKSLTVAARQFDANQLDVASGYNDTRRSIGSQLASAGSSAQNGRLNAFQQQQEAAAQAWNEFYKNNADTWTNIQRTEAGNTNIDSDYSTGYTPRYSKQAIDEIAKNTGKVYEIAKPDPGWLNAWPKQTERERNGQLGQRAAAVSAGPIKRAEGATQRVW